MTRVLAIARLTFWEGIRMKIVLVFVVVLFFIMLRLPFAVKGDETLAGRLQTFLSYSLGAVGVFLSLSTVFLSCATLTDDIRRKSIHLVLTKPVSRFEVLVGKWIGVALLNLLLLVLSGLVIYAFAVYIKTRPAQFVRDRINIDEVIWTARAASYPEKPDFYEIARQRIEERIKQRGELDVPKQRAIQQLVHQMSEDWKRIRPLDQRLFVFKDVDLARSKQGILQVSFKARAVPERVDEILYIDWVMVDPETHAPLQLLRTEERSAVRHQFLIKAKAVKNQTVAIGVVNPPENRRSAIYFEGDDGLVLLYPQGSFAGNYVKTLLLIFYRLAFLSAIALFFGTFVSFPVACFCVLCIFLFCIGVPWWLEAIGADITRPNPKIDPYGALGPLVRTVLVPMLKVGLPNFSAYSGVEKLIDGRVIETGLMIKGAAHTLVYGLTLLLLPGWLIFRSREVAQVIV